MEGISTRYLHENPMFLDGEGVAAAIVLVGFRAVIVGSIWDDEAVYEAVEVAAAAEAEAAPGSEKKRMGKWVRSKIVTSVPRFTLVFVCFR
jgi:hypothetical protein